MQKHLRTIILSGVLAVMAGTYLIFFTGGGGPDHITILTRLDRPRRFNPMYPIHEVRFGFDRPTELTELIVEQISQPEPEQEPEEPTGEQVFTLDQAAREAAASGPVWHLVAEQRRSEPVQAFSYGQRIRGMTRANPDERSRRLEPGVTYLLTVKAGKVTGTTEFETSFFQEPEEAPEQPAGGGNFWQLLGQRGGQAGNNRGRQRLQPPDDPAARAEWEARRQEWEQRRDQIMNDPEARAEWEQQRGQRRQQRNQPPDDPAARAEWEARRQEREAQQGQPPEDPEARAEWEQQREQRRLEREQRRQDREQEQQEQDDAPPVEAQPIESAPPPPDDSRQSAQLEPAEPPATTQQ